MKDSEKNKAELLGEITALKEQLTEMERRFALETGDAAAPLALIVDTAEEAIIFFEADRKILTFNQGAERIFGHSQANMIGHPLDGLLPGQDGGGVSEILAPGAGSAHTHSGGLEIEGRRKNGQTFPAEASLSSIEHQGSKIFALFLRDITGRVVREVFDRREATAKA